MIANILRAAVLSLPLAIVSTGLALASERTKPAEQDTTNGVAPLKEVPATEATARETPGHAGPAVPGSKPAEQPAEVAAASAAPAVSDTAEAKHYCDNIAAVAAEARFAWQTRKLTELQGQVAERVTELEKKQAELQASLARRDEIMKRAAETLVTIYAKMQPDAAAAQLMLLEDANAAAILAQLSPRQSSAILNEIRPERATQIVGAMTSLPQSSDKTDGKKS